MYRIYLKCTNGEGYFTGTILTSNGKEVCVHPYKQKAKTFDNREFALNVAKQLRAQFSCVLFTKICD